MTAPRLTLRQLEKCSPYQIRVGKSPMESPLLVENFVCVFSKISSQLQHCNETFTSGCWRFRACPLLVKSRLPMVPRFTRSEATMTRAMLTARQACIFNVRFCGTYL